LLPEIVSLRPENCATQTPDQGRLQHVFLTITTTCQPATDLGFLLHKHPDRVQSFDEPSGRAYVFYPEATRERCTAALLLEVDPVGLVRGRRAGSGPAEGFALGQYVNDRPYAASSLLAMALKDVFRSALAGRCDARPELAAELLPLEISIPALPCRGGGADLNTGDLNTGLVRRVFEPLGWEVTATASLLDPQIPDWGQSRYLAVTLTGAHRLAAALNHLYVLLPVLDDAKHYWVSSDEVDKLIRAGAGWLAGHPEKELITRRYLTHRRELTQSALARLAESDDTAEDDLDNATEGGRDLAVCLTTGDLTTGDLTTGADKPEPLHQLRRGAVLAAIRAAGARRVGDLGCGDGVLTADLLADRDIEHVTATDVSARALQHAARRLRLERMTEMQRARIELFQSSLTYTDDRLKGLDAAVLMEVIEHVDPPRLAALARTVFGHAAPATIIVTTPNVEYNVRFETLPAGASRHRDHRFEWTRAQFRDWAGAAGARYGYAVRYLPVGPDDPEVGPPTQLAVFTRVGAA
jgi:3' terminal RNA ribose 2'-O-methyltransferase Hen1